MDNTVYLSGQIGIVPEVRNLGSAKIFMHALFFRQESWLDVKFRSRRGRYVACGERPSICGKRIQLIGVLTPTGARQYAAYSGSS